MPLGISSGPNGGFKVGDDLVAANGKIIQPKGGPVKKPKGGK